ncbi:DUF4238 domain-containing protein, partial [Patescibacteria group bacterium]|nr:DUF4238 domain-containing protein [Patescibacteria group bacterium]
MQLFALNKNDGNSFPTHIRNIASENGFYNFDYKDERLSIEYPLAQLEDVISKIIYKIIAEESLASTTDNDKQILSFFLSVQKIRGNSTRETLKEMNQLLMKHLMDMGADPSKVEGFQNLEEDDVKKISIEMVLDADRFAPYFYDKTWLLYRTEESLPFIISDTPITLQNSNDFGFFGNLGLNVPGIEIYFPLSPTLTLAIVCNSLEGSFRDAQKKYDFITNYDPKLLEDFN